MARPWLLPALVLLLALGLRLPGLDSLLPHHGDPDDHAVRQAQRLRGGDPAADPLSWGKYGHLVARVLALWPEPASAAPLDPGHLDEHLRVAGADHLRARWIAALLGALAVPATFFLARRWMGPGWAVVAALFLACSLMHVVFSRQARPHAPFTTLAVLTLLTALRFRRAPGRGSAALLALALFAAAGTLHSAAFLLPAWLAALLLREPGRARPAAAWCALPLLAVALALLAFWPFLLADSDSLQLVGRTIDLSFPHLVEAGMFGGGGFEVWLQALVGYDPALLVAAALGAAFALARLACWPAEAAPARRDAGVVLAFAVPCALAFGLFERSFERFFLPLQPLLAVLAALGLRDVTHLLARRPAPRAALGALLVAAGLALPAWAAGRFAWLQTRPDTLELAARALDALDPARTGPLLLSRLGCPPVVGPLPADADTGSSLWLRYVLERQRAGHAVAGRPLVPFPPELFRNLRERPAPGEEGVLRDELIALDATWVLHVRPDGEAAGDRLGVTLARSAQLAWRVSDEPAALFAENGYQEHDMLEVVLHAPAWGPRVTLWKLR